MLTFPCCALSAGWVKAAVQERKKPHTHTHKKNNKMMKEQSGDVKSSQLDPQTRSPPVSHRTSPLSVRRKTLLSGQRIAQLFAIHLSSACTCYTGTLSSPHPSLSVSYDADAKLTGIPFMSQNNPRKPGRSIPGSRDVFLSDQPINEVVCAWTDK